MTNLGNFLNHRTIHPPLKQATRFKLKKGNKQIRNKPANTRQLRAGNGARAEGKMKAEKGRRSPRCFSALIFVGMTGQLSNQFIRDLIALNALISKIEHLLAKTI